MTKTLRERLEAALQLKGEMLVKRLTNRFVYTRKEGGFYYLGRSGSIRFGKTSTDSIPVSDSLKKHLLELTNVS